MRKPLFRIICHCKTCQEYCQNVFNDECTFKLSDLPEINLEKIAFKSYQSKLSPIRRGVCKICGHLAICIAKVPFVGCLIMIPSKMLKSKSLPAPCAHVYYDRRVANANDEVIKVAGHLRSQIVIYWNVLKSLMSLKKRL